MQKPITNTQIIMILKNRQKLIRYLDMNNSYGCGLTAYLPYGKFKWLKNVDWFDVNSISEKSPIVYFLEVDLEYRKELHELHMNYMNCTMIIH